MTDAAKKSRASRKVPVPPAALNLTTEEAATVIGIGRTRVYSLINAGKLSAFKHGRRTLIPRAEAERVARELPKLAAA